MGADAAEGQRLAVEKFRSRFISAPRVSMIERQQRTAGSPDAKNVLADEQVPITAPQEQTLCERVWQSFRDLSIATENDTVHQPHYATRLNGIWFDPSRPSSSTGANADSRVLLYLHGGAYNSGGPATARPIVKQLCDRNGCRAFIPQYRLGSQHMFPAQLLDALMAFFFLLSPPPGAAHAAIPAHNVVLVGESAGASLALAVLQFLLHEQRRDSTAIPLLSVYGRNVPLQLPAGLALLSAVGDWTFSLPSNQRYMGTDILVGEPWLQPDFPPDAIWPSKPPRGEAFCDPEALCHPMISPAACCDWTGAPPMWICCGEEVLADSIMLIAQRAAQQGVKVDFLQYEGMPHVFPLFMRGLPQAVHCITRWAAACSQLGTDERTTSKARLIRLGQLDMEDLDVRNLLSLSSEQASEIMADGRARKTRNVYTGTSSTRALKI